MMNTVKIPEISIIVPVFNSESIIPHLLGQIEQAMRHSILSFELILVDDCSTDHSFAKLQELANDKENYRVFKNEHNLGQAYTSLFGLSKAIGSYLVTIDDDLEYDPEDIRLLYEAIQLEKLPVVFGLAKDKYQKQGKSGPLSKFRNSLLNLLWNKPVTDSFKIVRRSFLFDGTKFLASVPFEVFLRDNLDRRHIGYVQVPFYPRAHGKSNYTLLKKIQLFWQMHLAFRQRN